MAGHFEPLPGGGAAAPLDEVEISILRSLAVQLMELIGPGEEPAEGDDPLAALFTEGPSEPPSDPALARLFPDAYGGPDEVPDDATHAAAAEFRRYTENDLRTRKREDALAVVRALDALGPVGGARRTDGSDAAAPEGAVDGAVLRLKPDESRQWLGALNDLRLAIGTRLEVTDEDESGELLRLPDSDPRKPMVMAYLWLGGLQESLIETLTA
ncbi:hypothetical protein OEIGOIKO_05171 [Streptomyces chrestomyceticus JCM 4735]|uniref:DUF2017 domain-containing protein n=1 Tax=Streptomyces chrestomyceticus JCM 4735 TaxID=1306181 RepID=A0A7U9KXT2_9ACTN|nr:DUF2017 domain-containing protein [Streptomyces chrestomyceticus]GCD37380.1 hypothetical protein OEIGOIKO_05171 [Streptomyces chrestomyceticus JCM 4735]